MYSVPAATCPLLYDPPFVLWLCLLAAAIGVRIFRILKAPGKDMSRLEGGLLATGVGLGLLSNVALFLGSLHLLTPRNVSICLLLLTLFFSPDMLRILRSCLRSICNKLIPSQTPRAPRNSPLLLFSSSPFLLLSAFLLFPLLQSLCPCTDADGLAYHLRAPKHWLQSGSLDFLPTLTHTNSPMGVEMLYTLPLAIWSDTSAKLIHFTFGLLALLAIFALGRRLHSAKVGMAAALFFALGLPKSPVLSLFTYAYVDLGITFEVMCATLAWFAWQRSRQQGWLIVSALCAGFAFAFKLTGSVYVLAFVLLTLWEQRYAPGNTELRPQHPTPGVPRREDNTQHL